jgi:hypothetical protein
VTGVLGDKFSEGRKAIGLVSGYKSVVELFVSVKGTWTLTLTNTKGVTCIIGAGEAWQDAPQQLAGIGS